MDFSLEEKKHPDIAAEDRFIGSFDKKIRSFVRMNLFFIAALVVEIILFISFIPFFLKSAFLSIMIALFVLTVFGYLVLKQYLESQKLLYFECLLRDFLKTEEALVKRQPQGNARICTRIAHRLYQREYKYYALPKRLNFQIISSFLERLSAYIHWQDVHQMREILLQRAVDEQIGLICLEPTNSDAHALLANAYVMLSALYVDPRKNDFQENERWIPADKYGEKMEQLFQTAAKKAIEEFKILQEYAPHDPWIYTQLAYSYRDLGMFDLEKEAYRSILNLRPNDHETRFNLGKLYFKQGENARGLKVFEELKKANYNKADELLTLYGQRNFSYE